MCQHAKVLAGHIAHQGRHAVGYYCPTCNSITYESVGRPPLRQSRTTDPDTRERAINAWLSRPAVSAS